MSNGINNRQGRQKTRIDGTGSVQRRGEGLGTGPVGNGKGPKGNGGGGPQRSGGGKLLPLIVVIIIVLAGGGGASSFLFGDNATSQEYDNSYDNSGGMNQIQQSNGGAAGGLAEGALTSEAVGSLGTSFSQMLSSSASSNTGYSVNTDMQSVNSEVTAGTRDKFTHIKGNGADKVTIMVYMCGTDLESKSGMATSDLMEMTKAKLSDNINLVVYTGGCRKWNNSIVSNKVNQIYQVKNGGLIKVESDMGDEPMVKSETLTSFIKYCKSAFPADRNELILWDHGGGSLSGFGYDEKNQMSGSMNLAGINQALKNSDMKFDFIGFDACLMATVENAIMLSQYADYLVGSEETEPGVGWYYTDWLTKLSTNTSMPTTEIGKNIVDDFVDVCNQKCRGQKTTLSVVDLAELSKVIPPHLSEFSTSIMDMLDSSNYIPVADARINTREFSPSSKIDQIDLADFANRIAKDSNVSEEYKKTATDMAEAVKRCVKYNRTSSNMRNAYGLSIYFPNSKKQKVDQMLSTYEMIGMNDEYSDCIRAYARMQTSGQVVHGGTSTPVPSLLDLLGSAGGQSSQMGTDVVSQMLGSFLSGGNDFGNMNISDFGFMSGRSLNEDEVQYLADNYFDDSNLVWKSNNSGDYVINLPEEQLKLVEDIELSVFYDDGTGYVDLGLDNVYEFDADNNLLGNFDNTWLSIDRQIVPYYYIDTTGIDEEQTITGYVPAYLNDERVKLIVVFDESNPSGYIAGATYDYHAGETDTIAKNLIEIKPGDRLDFICDYYSYDGTYQDSYLIGDTITLGNEVLIGNISFEEGAVVRAMYCFTDIYGNRLWTPAIPK